MPTKQKDYSQATGVNWMYMGLYEWTISRDADLTYTIHYIDHIGRVWGAVIVLAMVSVLLFIYQIP